MQLQKEFVTELESLGLAVRAVEGSSRKVLVHVKTDRLLKVEWSEAAFDDLKAFHGVDAAAEFYSVMLHAIRTELAAHPFD